jgi:hypothetical protein
MPRILAILALLLLALPAAAQSPGAAPLPAPVPARIALPQPAEATLPGITAGHAAALGAGMFVGAMAGTAFINGGAVAALIGAAAGLTIGHWYWTARPDDAD